MWEERASTNSERISRIESVELLVRETMLITKKGQEQYY